MIFDMTALPRQRRYQLMTATITPRPVAWVTSLSQCGLANAAPFSFFNMMGDDPPVIALGLMLCANGERKDTAQNIAETGEFVVNLVSEAQADAMNLTAQEMPADVDELVHTGIAVAPSQRVAVPRILEAPVSFECITREQIHTSPRQVIVIGEIVVAHIQDRFLLGDDKRHVDTPALRLVARMHGGDWYARQTDLFRIARPGPFGG